MRILLLTDGIYPFTMGGMQKHSYFLAKYLSLSGVEVEIAHCSDNLELKDELSNIVFDTFNKDIVSSSHFTFPKLDRFPGHYMRESKCYSQLLFDFYKDDLNQYDAIYAQGFTAFSFLSKKDVPPVFVNFHGYEMYQKAPSLRVKLEHYLLRGAVKYISNSADFVFSFGGKITDVLTRLGVSKSSIIESPIGIEEDWLNNQSLKVNDVRKIVFIGRYERRKGIEELNQAINLLPNNINLDIQFIGPIPEENRISNNKVTYHGAVYDVDVIKNVLKSSDVLICPSYSEGMPTVIMEAMASGLAIVATNVGAISKQVSKENGILLEQADVTLIKNALTQIASLEADELLEMKKVSLLKIKNNFLWSKVIVAKLEGMNNKLN